MNARRSRATERRLRLPGRCGAPRPGGGGAGRGRADRPGRPPAGGVPSRMPWRSSRSRGRWTRCGGGVSWAARRRSSGKSRFANGSSRPAFPAARGSSLWRTSARTAKFPPEAPGHLRWTRPPIHPDAETLRRHVHSRSVDGSQPQLMYPRALSPSTSWSRFRNVMKFYQDETLWQRCLDM
jgi:hypothetical protein